MFVNHFCSTVCLGCQSSACRSHSLHLSQKFQVKAPWPLWLHKNILPDSVSWWIPRLVSGREWAAPWGRSGIGSTRWTQGRPAGRRWCRTCTSAESRRRRSKTETQSRSPTARRDAAGGAKDLWASLYCCDALPTSCYIEPGPRRRRFCQPTHVLVLTCKQYPRQTSEKNKHH